MSIEVGDPRLGVWLKGRVNRSIGLSADFMGLGIVNCTGICLAGSSGPRRFDWRLDASITEAGLDLSLPTRLRLGRFEPYFQGGMGVRRYRFHRPDPSELLRFSPPSDGTAWSFRIGGGTDFSLMGRTFSLSVMDTMTKYWGDRLHHLFVEVSIPVLSRVLFASYSSLQER